MDGNLFADSMGGVSDYVCGFAASKRGDNLASLRSRSGNAGYIGGWVQGVGGFPLRFSGFLGLY